MNVRKRHITEFSLGQVVYMKNNRQSNKADGYNAKLGPNRIRYVVLQRKGKALYELGEQALLQPGKIFRIRSWGEDASEQTMQKYNRPRNFPSLAPPNRCRGSWG